MVSGKTNVFTIASWNREANRINTYAYVFMNLETRYAYKTLFERLFQVLGDVGRLGDYLASLDPRWTWQEHLQRVLIFCETHVKRAFKKKFGAHDATPLIDLILRADELSKVLGYMDQAAEVWPETANWFKNKRTPWILAGLTREASKIPIYWWIAAPHHTGICESSHFVDNEAIGRKQSLLAAILNTKRHVINMVEKTKLAAEEGRHLTWKPADAISRISKASHRKNTRNRASAERRKRKSHMPYKPSNPYDLIEISTSLIGPPPRPDSDINSDSISISDAQTIQLSRSRSRSHSLLTRSQSVQPRLAELAELQKEEERLQQEIELIERRERIQKLRQRLDSLR
ncbi:hypothetical protein PEBR_21922 [Penicillium brasilianum]|uniref:Uncharacterized protein n=1 Tax=Penicillium brasilianum TaxID=104259 RepID=A0A1S9RLV0_PENBI|nr:hypothetical protein PEBR_21922 [Penicillium brasilianum]